MANFKAGFLQKLRNLTEKDLVAVCFEMAERHPDTFETILLTNSFEPSLQEFTVPTVNTIIKLTPEQVEMCKQLGAQPDKKVVLIKQVREWTNLGLKEAKDLVEAYWFK